MSIAAMMREAAHVDATAGGAGRSGRRSARAAASQPEAPPASEAAAIAEGLSKYIPTEAVALYTGVLPFLVSESDPLSEGDFATRWALAIVVAVVAVLFGVGVYRQEVKVRNEAFRWPVRRTALILFAFAAWVFVIPGSPFGSFDWYTPSIGAIGGILAGTAIALFLLWYGAPESADDQQPNGGGVE